MAKRVIICADDYGISPGVSEGICRLAEKKNISATSVMVVYDDWNRNINALLDSRENLDIGLHLVLTNGPPVCPPEKIPSLVNVNGYFPTVGQVIRNSLFGKISLEEVAGELHAQHGRFVDCLGFKPDFIDGHHNVHQFPIVRQAVLSFLADKKSIYTRNTAISFKNIIRQGSDYCKTFPISLWGRSFKTMTKRKGIPTNESFGGIYNLNYLEHFEEKLSRFLELTKSNGLIMTHPGLPDAILAERDSFTCGRKVEFDLLFHSCFKEVLQKSNSSLARFDFGVS